MTSQTKATSGTEQHDVTLEQFTALAAEAGNYELLNGKLLYTRLPSPFEYRVLNALQEAIGHLLKGSGYKLMRHLGIRFPTPKPTVLSPPLAVYEKLAMQPYQSPHDCWPPLSPILVLDVATCGESKAKVRLYLESGAREVWLLDTAEESISVWTEEGRKVKTSTVTLPTPLSGTFSIRSLFLESE